jgi:hypothetical protein
MQHLNLARRDVLQGKIIEGGAQHAQFVQKQAGASLCSPFGKFDHKL